MNYFLHTLYGMLLSFTTTNLTSEKQFHVKFPFLVQDTQQWQYYILLDIFHCFDHGKSSIADIMLQLKRNPVLYDLCLVPKTKFHPKQPCGQLSFSSFDQVAMYKWEFEVHASLSINITITSAYTKYTDDCGDDYIAVYETSQAQDVVKLGQFCGHVTLETVYTELNKGSLHIYIFSYFSMIIHALFQAQTSGIAYRLHGSKFSNIEGINISVPDPPLWVYIFSGKLDFIWYYTLPSYQTFYKYICRKHEHLFATYCDLIHFDIELRIDFFICGNTVSYIKLLHALWPYTDLHRRDGFFSFHCNRTQTSLPPTKLSVVRHRFLTILLSISDGDQVIVALSFVKGPAFKTEDPDEKLCNTKNHPLPYRVMRGTLSGDYEDMASKQNHLTGNSRKW